MNDPIQQLIHIVKLKQAEIKFSTATGVPQSWDSYQRMVGVHQGLQDVLDMIDNMLEEDEVKSNKL